jgi:hypothetical protein
MLHAVIGVNGLLVDPTQGRRQSDVRFSLSVERPLRRAREAPASQES